MTLNLTQKKNLYEKCCQVHSLTTVLNKPHTVVDKRWGFIIISNPEDILLLNLAMKACVLTSLSSYIMSNLASQFIPIAIDNALL